MANGFLAIVLHSHLPFVRHPEHAEFLEEDWLFEAIAETYLPLLEMLDGLARDAVPFQLTFSLTPTLCTMLRDPLLQERAARYLDRSVALANAELDRTRNEPHWHALAEFYHERLTRLRKQYEETWKRDLVAAFGKFQELGLLEIITCAATHGFLPLMANSPEAVRAQIFTARDHYHECFGRDPAGIWLPECAYAPGVETVLQEADFRWFIIDAHGLMFGQPRPRCAIYAPAFTPSGVAAFARDRESSRQVWSSLEGYPGDPAYRDFYRDIGFDLPQEAIRPFLPENETGGARKFTGLKYHRITGPTPHKEPYHRDWALGAADSHATHFMESRRKQIAQLCEHANFDPIVVSPFDTELFGHWWFEGPEFLNWFIRKSAYDQTDYRLTTPGNYLAEHSTLQIVQPSASSWGDKGYWEVWLNETNSWIYPHLHAAAQRMTESARRFANDERAASPLAKNDSPSAENASSLANEKSSLAKTDSDLAEKTASLAKPISSLANRTLQQMARELLLAQASDWAFLMRTGTAHAYAVKQTRDHLLRFNRLYEQLRDDSVDEDFLKTCENRDNIFPNIEWKNYL